MATALPITSEANDAVVVEIRPQPGPQELILSCPADIGVIGGSLFGGKTWSLVYEPLRHVHIPGFSFVAFRREMPEHTNPGGMWDESLRWYPLLDGEAREHTHDWFFPSGAWGKFAGLQHELDVEAWKGAQVPLFLFDQLESFSESQFFYMLSRNRSSCGVRPYVRASCNPDPDSFLATLLAWWIDNEGWAIPARSGVIRWFIRINDALEWSRVTCRPEEYERFAEIEAAAKADLSDRFPDDGRFATSIAFVLARLQDNVIGNQRDPQYEGKIRAMSFVQRQRLLGGDRGGNWKIRPSAGLIFNRAWFEIVEAAPGDCIWVRYWDKAGTEKKANVSASPAMTAGVKMGYSPSRKTYYMADAEYGYWRALQRENVIKQKALADGKSVRVYHEQEPGSGGKESAEGTTRNLAGWNVHADRVTGDKIERAMPLSAQAEAGNVKLLRGPWNEAFLQQAHAFAPGRSLKDIVDAAVGAFNKLSGVAVGQSWGTAAYTT